MRCYRICRAAHAELDGEGARISGGRWNSPGRPVVYTSSSIALAALEYLGRIDIEDVPDDLVLLTIELPKGITKRNVAVASLRTGWDATKGVTPCRMVGDQWLDYGREAILRVPSAAIPEEENVLINPRHPEAKSVVILHRRPFAFDERLL